MNKDQTIKQVIQQNNKLLDFILLQVDLKPKLLQALLNQKQINEKAIDLF